jgi:hypothetical protein
MARQGTRRYDRSKHPRMIRVRPMNFNEAKALDGGHVQFIGRQGDLRRAKVNGRVRLWKRDPMRIEVPIKYGMYEYTTFFLRTDSKIGNDVAYLVVEESQ